MTKIPLNQLYHNFMINIVFANITATQNSIRLQLGLATFTIDSVDIVMSWILVIQYC